MICYGQTDEQRRTIPLTLVATRLKYDPTSKVDVQQQMLGLACVSMPVKLCFLSIHSM